MLGRAAAVKLLQSCNDWMGVREAGTQLVTQDTALLAAGLVSV